MPSPTPMNLTKAASTNQQPGSKLSRRHSSSSEQVDCKESSPIEYSSENSKNKGTNSTAQQSNNNNSNSNHNSNSDNNIGGGVSIHSSHSYHQDNSKYPFKKWCKKKFDEYKLSLVLDNKASVARDHLANERTFLAWLRTSLSFIGIGVATTQLFRLRSDSSQGQYEQEGKIMGMGFMILGIIFLFFGVGRYFHSQYLMTQGHFPASRGSVILGTILTILALAACFFVIIIDSKK